MKRITIPRSATIFLLFGIGLYIGLVLIYTFKVLFVTAIIYFVTIPVSYFHYQKLKNKEEKSKQIEEVNEVEDIL